jgi:DNA-binding CsgD family transcriptional regulator
MLYSIHVYGRIFGYPDLALARGAQAHRAARDLGDRALEFVAAGGMALTHLQFDETEEAGRWLDKAATAAAGEPTPLRARRLEFWRGLCAGRGGHADEMVQHLNRAVTLATEQGRPGARCETLAWLALEAGRLGIASGDDELLETAARCAGEATELAATLPGHPPWGLFAASALVQVLLARGDGEGARAIAGPLVRTILGFEERALYPEPSTPLARALASSEDPEDRELARTWASPIVGLVAERTADADVLRRWQAVPEHRELADIAGGVEAAREFVRAMPDSLIAQRLPVLPLDLTTEESALMRLMMEGRSDREIARELSLEEAQVTRQLSAVFAKIGAPSRSVATLYAFMADLV